MNKFRKLEIIKIIVLIYISWLFIRLSLIKFEIIKSNIIFGYPNSYNYFFNLTILTTLIIILIISLKNNKDYIFAKALFLSIFIISLIVFIKNIYYKYNIEIYDYINLIVALSGFLIFKNHNFKKCFLISICLIIIIILFNILLIKVID